MVTTVPIVNPSSTPSRIGGRAGHPCPPQVWRRVLTPPAPRQPRSAGGILAGTHYPEGTSRRGRALSIGFGQRGGSPRIRMLARSVLPCYGKGWERAFQVFDLLM
jgi:hypothetical protein